VDRQASPAIDFSLEPRHGAICITQFMDENAKPAPPSLGRWIGLIVAAVLLAEGIWGILVSLTRSLVLPMLARVMGTADPQSPLYLGKGDLNISDLFAAVLELCFAGILFLMLRAWASKSAVQVARVQKPVPQRVAPVVTAPPLAPSPAPIQAAPISPPVAAPAPPPKPAPPPAVSTKPPAKPQKPKEIIYNSVGEPINPAED